MGEFYGNIHVRTEDRAATLAALKPIASGERMFLVSPQRNGWVSVYPNDYGQDAKLSNRVAKRIQGDVIHLLLHDGTDFCYWYYRSGKLIDKYSSRPDYFGPVSQRLRRGLQGRPGLLKGLLVPGSGIEQLQAALDEMRSESHVTSLAGRFAALLGIINFDTAYEDLIDEETDGVEGWDAFVHLPDVSPELRRRRQLEAEAARETARLREERVLLLELSSKLPPIRAWCLDDSTGRLLVGLPRAVANEPAAPHNSATLVACYGPPWFETPLETFEIGPEASGLIVSPSGRYLATAHGLGPSRTVVRDREAGADVWQLEGRPIQFSAGERRLYVLSANELLVCDLESKQISRHKCESNAVAVHPGEEWAVGGSQFGVSLINLHTGDVSAAMPVGLHRERAEATRWVEKMVADLRTLGPEGAFRKLIDEQVSAQLQLFESLRADPESRKAIEAMERRGSLEQTVRQDLEKYIPLYKSLLEGGLAGGAPRRSEEVTQLEFTPDGEKLLCAATQGVRVLSWDDLRGASDCSPPPLWAVESEVVKDEHGNGYAFTYAIEFDCTHNRLLFSGLEGKIRFLEMNDSATGTLIELPRRPAAQKLALSHDGAVLACWCRTGLLDRRDSALGSIIQVWDYPRLCELIPSNPATGAN